MPSGTRILIADDHELIRQGIRKVLEARPGWLVCGEAATGREAVAKAKDLKPDVVVMDFGMPELNGLEATRQIRQALPATEVLILTMHDSGRLAREALAAGARGFLLKTDLGGMLLTALEDLSRHKSSFTPRIAELVLSGSLPGADSTSREGGSESRLTPREREIVQLLAEGKSNKEVGEALGISVHTAETHRTNLMRKLGLHSMSELVRFAIRERFIEP